MAKHAKKHEQSTAPPAGAGAPTATPGDARPLAQSSPGSAETVPGAAEDAVALLKADHRKVEGIFQKFKSAGSPTEKKQYAEQACHELVLHTLLEEELFYPACRQAGVQGEALDEAQVEHDGVKVLMAAIATADPRSRYYEATVTVLSEYVKHHVNEEERDGGIFSKAKDSGMDLKALGEKIRARKQSGAAERSTPAAPDIRSFDISNISRRISADNSEENSMSRQYDRPRDEHGRFESDDRDDRSRTGRYYSQRRDEDDDGGDGGRWENRGGGSRRSSEGFSRDEYEDDNRRSSRGGRGWHGDPEGHSRAAEERWESRGRSSGRQGSYSGSEREDEDYGRSSGRGWYGDSEGHSRAAEERWEGRGSSGRGGGSQSRGERDDEDDGRSSSRRRGWYGDPEGHSRASEEGWEHRGSGSRRSGGSYSRSERDHEDNGRSSSRGRGWYGDPEGHSRASEEGWEHRDRGSRSGSSSRQGSRH